MLVCVGQGTFLIKSEESNQYIRGTHGFIKYGPVQVLFFVNREL